MLKSRNHINRWLLGIGKVHVNDDTQCNSDENKHLALIVVQHSISSVVKMFDLLKRVKNNVLDSVRRKV